MFRPVGFVFEDDGVLEDDEQVERAEEIHDAEDPIVAHARKAISRTSKAEEAGCGARARLRSKPRR
jgi:hypothetical protein